MDYMVKVVFYTFTPRAFRSTLIGHLYEICQKYPTVLLSEELDNETTKLLQDKNLFPHLESIIPVRQFTAKDSIFSQNRRLSQQAKKIIETQKPTIVISAADHIDLFSLYLLRFAKQAGNLTLTIQPTLLMGEMKIIRQWVDSTNAYLKLPRFIPLPLRFFLTRLRKIIGHIIFYWIMPIMVGQKPFLGKSSYVLRKGNSGMRDTDLQITFSKRDYEIYRKDGVPRNKLRILSHPLSRTSSRRILEKLDKPVVKEKKQKSIVGVVFPSEFTLGFQKPNWQPVQRDELEKRWLEILSLISQALNDWEVYIKPHPDSINLSSLSPKLTSISKGVKVLAPSSPADECVAASDIIVGFPPSASTVLFTASVQSPDKPILSLDFYQEVFGDYYKNFEGVEYVTSKGQLTQLLKLIRDGKYKKSLQVKSSKGEFSGLVELVENLLVRRAH